MLSNAHLANLPAHIARIYAQSKPPKVAWITASRLLIAATKFFNQENAVFWYLDEVAFLIIPASLYLVIPAKSGIRGRPRQFLQLFLQKFAIFGKDFNIFVIL